MEIVFWFIVFLLFHSYLLYPLVIRVLSLFYNKKTNLINSSYKISILISVFNEEKVIRERIENIANLDYDFSRVEVLVGSDNSMDRTNKILKDLKNIYPWLEAYFFQKRRGKVSVLNDLVKKTKNEILIFTDANTIFYKNTIQKLVSGFADPAIGGISGRLKLTENKISSANKTEEKKYWEYETFIKKYEGKCGVLIGANGGIFAIRKKLYREIPLEKPVTDDLFISLSILQLNLKFVYEFNALAIEESAPGIKNEFKRKIRFGATNLNTLLYFKDLLFNKNILLSYSLWTHKIIRWFSPIFLILIFLLSIILFSRSELYQIILIMQIVICLLAGLGILLKRINIYISPFVMMFYFFMTNVALFIGLIKFLLKKQTAFWQSTPR